MTELACSRIKRRISRRRPPQQSVLSTSYGGKFTVSRPNAAVTDKIPNEVGSCGVHAPEGGALHQAYRTCKQGNKVNSYGVANSIGHGEVAPAGFEPIRRQPPRSFRLIRYRGALSPDVHHPAFRDVPGRKTGSFCAKTEIARDVLFPRRCSVDFPEMANHWNFSRGIWIHQLVWRFLPCHTRISAKFTIRGTNFEGTVHRTGISPTTVLTARYWIDWLAHECCLFECPIGLCG